jgi:lipopolysaccharide export system protein LptA
MGPMSKSVAGILAWAFTLFHPHVTMAAGNVSIDADNMEIIDAEHKTIFRGNVVAKRPTDTIKSDEMTVFSSDQKQIDGTTKSVTDHVDAQGNVTINTRDAVILGEWANIDMLHDHMVVGGNVVLTQGTSVVRGQKLDVDLKTFHLNMAGGRVNGNFTPN